MASTETIGGIPETKGFNNSKRHYNKHDDNARREPETNETNGPDKVNPSDNQINKTSIVFNKLKFNSAQLSLTVGSWQLAVGS